MRVYAGQEGQILTQNRRLRSADSLLAPALATTVAALNPPDADAALVRLAEVIAATIDDMPDAVRVTMLPNHTGQLVKTLAELEARAARRRMPASGAPNRLQQLRAARTASDAGRRR